MYRILVVDDDETCLFFAKACLKRWNYYEVRALNDPLQALSIMDEEEKPYDLVLADVHMPVMDGFELMRHVTTKFNIPVVLISADHKAEMMCEGLRNGAPAYLLKPITADHVRHIWQYSELWKNKERNSYNRRITQATVPRSICSSSSSNRDIEDKPKKKAKETVWKPNLHSRFVEVMLILGPKNDVPKKIVEVMNVQSITREQVASHLQKFRKFLKSVLDGKTSLNDTSKSWIDCNYYSSIVGGNPNQILIDQLFEERRTGKSADPIPASLPLPPYNESEASSSRRRNTAMLMPINYASSSVNAATYTPGLGRDINFPSGVNVAMTTFGHGGLANFSSADNLNLGNFVGGSSIYNQNTVVQQQNYYLPNTDLQIGSGQHHNDSVIDGSFYTNQFEVASGINDQLRSIQLDPNIGNSFGGGNEFGNASPLPQLGGGAEMADAGRVINNSTGLNNIPEADYSLLSIPKPKPGRRSG